MEFIAKTYDASGKRSNQKLSAGSEQEAVRILTGEKYIVLDICPARRFLAWKSSLFIQNEPRQLLLFTRQLKSLILAGIHLGNALRILAGQAKNGAWQTAIRQIESDVYAGNSLAQALKHQPQYFSSLYVSLVQVGEAGGVLPQVLSELMRYLEREQSLRSKLRQAMLYPAIILSAAVLVVLLLLLLVIPSFSAMFAEAGLTLPWLTRGLILVSSGLREYGIYLLFALWLLALGFRFWSRSLAGRKQWHRRLLKLPIVGRVFHQAVMGRMAFSLALLIKSGVSLLSALQVSETVVENAAVQELLTQAGQRIRDGDSLSLPLEESGLLDQVAIHMIAVGEETGALDQMLAGLADFYDSELQFSLTSLFTLLEPVLILTVGVIVGIIVIAALLPMFDFMAIL